MNELVQNPVPRQPQGWLGWLERACEAITIFSLAAMVLIIVVEIVTRNLFGFSLQVSDEVCGYLLVATTFLGMPTSFLNGGFHKMDLLEGRLKGAVGFAVRLATDIVALAVCLLIEWQLVRLAMQTYKSGNIAMTDLRTPLWLPQAIMPIGFGILCLAMAAKLMTRSRQPQLDPLTIRTAE